MRFVRAYTKDGVLLNISEREIPFEDERPTIGLFQRNADGSRTPVALEQHELGVAEDFKASHPDTGASCCASAHLFHRLEVRPDGPVAPNAPAIARFRAKAGSEALIPIFHSVPTHLPGIKTHIRENGPGAIPERVAHWLEFIGAFSGDEMDAHGLPRLTITRAFEFDAMRQARDPTVGSRLETFKRQLRERAARSSGNLRSRQGVGA